MQVAIIAAVAQHGVIGLRGGIPWRLPADLRYFKRIALGHHLLMGRKAYESMGKPLQGRVNVVVSGKPGLVLEGCHVVDSLQAGTPIRQSAIEKGALTVSPNTEVLDIETEHGRVKAVVTDRGRIEADYVVVACGVWSPRSGRMAGATIPLTPAPSGVRGLRPRRGGQLCDRL